MGRKTFTLAIIFVVVLIVSALASYYFFNRPASSTAERPGATTTVQRDAATDAQAQPSQPAGGGDDSSSLPAIFNSGSSSLSTSSEGNWAYILLMTTVRLTLAALFTAILAFRPRRSGSFLKRNLFVAQTQILLAVVGSALMMIVGDSAARAFGIFAAVSLVRFRTNISDPKEITVLLVSLSVGLATGVGRWELAATLSLFVLILLWALEFRESKLVFRSMELKVATRNLIHTHEAVRDILTKHNFNSELRTLNREDEDEPLGEVVFCVELSPGISTDVLSDEILASDHNNIDSIEWSHQKKGAVNTFQ
jgi:uncharacterized membrane protein YhiD involved in acid resistance